MQDIRPHDDEEVMEDCKLPYDGNWEQLKELMEKCSQGTTAMCDGLTFLERRGKIQMRNRKLNRQ